MRISNSTLMLGLLVLGLAGPLLGLAACERSSIYAERAIPMLAPPASAETPPNFVGRWAASDAQCKDPWVVKARSLKGAGVTCDFAQVEQTIAGYSVASVCRRGGGPRPGRLNMIMTDPQRPTLMTVSGGPFDGAMALQRCAS